MSGKSNIVDRVVYVLERHNNSAEAQVKMQAWTDDRLRFFLEKLARIESSLDKGDHASYRVAFNQLKVALNAQRDTLNRLHDALLYEQGKHSFADE